MAYSPMTAIHITVDDRERAIIEQMSSFENVPFEWNVARLSLGDYEFTICGITFLIVERKTYCDLASSIKDGRIDNFAGLIAARSAFPNVRIALLLEGPRPKGIKSQGIDGIPYKALRAKIAHLWLRDNIYLIETRRAARNSRAFI